MDIWSDCKYKPLVKDDVYICTVIIFMDKNYPTAMHKSAPMSLAIYKIVNEQGLLNY